MEDVTFMILKIVVSVVSALIAAYLIPYIKAKIADVKYANLVEMVQVAVYAAEQTIKGSGQGKIKKEEVVLFVTDWLNAHGIRISSEEIDALIEASVYAMKQTQGV